MVIPESDPFPDELPKRGSCFLSDKVRTHSVPYHYDHMAIRFWHAGSDADNPRGKNQHEDQRQYAIFLEHDWSQITQTASD
jgi:hypothetical protein